jgi:two-component system sensor kinase FixL
MPNEILAQLTREHDVRLYAELTEVASTTTLSEMSSAIAHELNQPLGAIATYAQAGKRLLAREPIRSTAIEVLEEINVQALAAGNGIHRIRARFATPPGKRSVCAPEPMVRDLCPILDAMALHYGVTLQVQSQQQLRLVLVDPLQIQYVLLVLAQNAMHAASGTPSAVVCIVITGDAYAIHISVTDSGTGVSPDVRDQLFRPFFTTKRNGIGLGLACGRSVVESHGGSIGYEEASGGATRFWFSLPATTE